MANNKRTAVIYVISRTMTRPKALQGRSANVPKEYVHEETIILSGIFFDLDLAEKTLEYERDGANEFTSYALHKIEQTAGYSLEDSRNLDRHSLYMYDEETDDYGQIAAPRVDFWAPKITTINKKDRERN